MKKIVTMLMIGAFSCAAGASGLSNPAIGVGAGNVQYSAGNNSDPAEGSASSVSLIAQFDVRDQYKFELAFSNLGEYTENDYTTEFTALTGTIVVPLTNAQGFQPYAKAGLGLLKMEQSFGSLSGSDTGSTLVAGLGLAYTNQNLPDLTVRAAYDYHYFKTENIISGDEFNNSLGAFSLSAIYHLK